MATIRKRTFTKEFLTEELDLPYYKDIIVENKIIDHRRWSIDYSLVFKHEGKFYSTGYSVGATEQQDESPWEYEKEIECVEVEKRHKLIEVWEPVVVVVKEEEKG